MEGRGFELVRHNLARERPSRELLARLIDEHGVENVVSTRSPAFKARNLDAKTLTKSAAIELILEDPNLIRRPLVMAKNDKVIFGYKPEEYDRLR